MNRKKSRRLIFILIGTMMILCGIILLIISADKTVKIIINGEVRTVRTHASRAADILQGAGISYDPSDQIRPGLNQRIRSGGRISINRALAVHLDAGLDSSVLDYISHRHFGGNILLDAGIRLYPGDRIFWKGTELRPDFNLSGIKELDIKLEKAAVFTLVTEDDPQGKIMHGSGETVIDALLSAGVSINKSMMVIPDGESVFTPGMIIEAVHLRDLTVSVSGKLVNVLSAGASVGEALARAGLPLNGSDVSIPAAGEPLPDDGRILIVPVSDSFSMKAEIIRRDTEWIANDELNLDDTREIFTGNDGLRGTFTRIRQENGETVLTQTSPETVLVQPTPSRAEYGTRINIETLNTPDGPVEYYRAVKVYATSYSPCRSGTSKCITGTASGMKVQKGVAAVTSDWYNHFGGQSIYIPDYGKAVIADVGGGIPGKNWIDLAYDDDNFEGWSRETTVYFLTPVPADMIWVLK